MVADLPPDVDPASRPPHPLGEAMVWVARIMAVALVMILPGLAGHWLDQRLGTRFLVLAGFALGITAGVYHLILVTAGLKRRPSGSSPEKEKRR